MMILQKLRQAMYSFMLGRNGMDSLSTTVLWGGVALYLLGSVFGLSIVSMLGMVAYGLAIFRIFSRNRAKRSMENSRFLLWRGNIQKKWKQAKIRYQNRKEYKYFKCLSCKSWLKIPRGAGVVTVTCSRCKTSFTQKG